MFFNFRHQTLDPGSGIRIRNPDPQLEKCWIRIRIRIRIKSMRIRNPGLELVDIVTTTHPRTQKLINSSPGRAGGIVRLSKLAVVLVCSLTTFLLPRSEPFSLKWYLRVSVVAQIRIGLFCSLDPDLDRHGSKKMDQDPHYKTVRIHKQFRCKSKPEA